MPKWSPIRNCMSCLVNFGDTNAMSSVCVACSLVQMRVLIMF